MLSLKSEELKILKYFLLFAPRRPTPLAPPPPPSPSPRSMIPRVGGAAGVGFCDDLRWRSPVVVVVAAGEGGQIIPASRSKQLLPQIKNPSSLKGGNVKGGGVLKGGRLGWGIGAVSGVHVRCSNASTLITIITMHIVARALAAAAGGWEAARRPDNVRRGLAKGVVCGAIAIAAVQHAQAADAGPCLQLASSRQRRRGAAGSWGASGACALLHGSAELLRKLIWT
jgi:hypothetical protein